MLCALAPAVAVDASAAGSAGHARGRLMRLRAALEEEVALVGGGVGVAVTEGCGAVEVLVSGPSGGLQLLFDATELHPAFVRHAVRRTVERYRSSLSVRPCGKADSRRE